MTRAGSRGKTLIVPAGGICASAGWRSSDTRTWRTALALCSTAISMRVSRPSTGESRKVRVTRKECAGGSDNISTTTSRRTTASHASISASQCSPKKPGIAQSSPARNNSNARPVSVVPKNPAEAALRSAPRAVTGAGISVWIISAAALRPARRRERGPDRSLPVPLRPSE